MNRVGPKGHLRGIELLEVLHAPEGFFGTEGDVIQLYTLDRDGPVRQGSGPIIVAAGGCHAQIGQQARSSSSIAPEPL